MASLPPVDWKGLFEWSMKYNDGTTGSGLDTSAAPMSEEDRKWFTEAMEHYSHDVVKRMREIKRVLDGGAIASTAVPDGGDGGGGEEVATQPAPRPPAGSSTATDTPPPPPDDPHAVPATDTARVALLDELVEIVESIDHARDLALIGGLPTLLALLASPAAPLRARAAEVLGTAAQSNPPVQDWFLEGGVLPAVLGMLAGGGGGGGEGGRGGGGGDPCPLARQKALFALSCLVRHCDRATDALLAGGGVPLLVAEASGEAAAGRPGAARKAWQLLSYLAAAGRPGVDVPSSAAGAGVGAALVTALSLPDGDGEVRGAAVGCAAALARAGGAGAAALGKDESVLCALRSLAGAEGGEGATGAGEALAALEAAAASGGGGGGGGGSGGAVMVV